MMKKIIGFFVCMLMIASALPAVGIINNDKNIKQTSEDFDNFEQKISGLDRVDWTQQDKITASDGESYDYFGYGVSLDGDYALIGASQKDDAKGSAYVFKRDGISWIQEDKLTASDGEPDDVFGVSVSLDGDYAILGAVHDDDNGYWSGSAYVFKRNGESWIQEDKLTASDGEAYDFFGGHVSLNANYALIGASGDDNGGSAYIFKRDGESWIQIDKLTASDGESGDYFGSDVSLDGDYALIGARNYNSEGSAYVFKRNGESWIQEDKLTASDGEPENYFGDSVSLDGDYAIIGATWDDDYQGSAYVFKRDVDSWIQMDKLTASDAGTFDWFGCSVSVEGNYAIIGAEMVDKAYVFKRDGSTWIQEDILTASDGTPGDDFGVSVSLNGNNVLIGANGDDNNKGAVYVFKKPKSDLECLGSLSWNDVRAGDIVLGSFKVANIGDSDTELSWEIESYPEWGTWTFVPPSGTGLTPEMGTITVDVEVVAPSEVNKEFTGDVKVVNSEDSNDFDTVPVLLKTPRNKAINRPFLNFLQDHPNMFPILRLLILQ